MLQLKAPDLVMLQWLDAAVFCAPDVVDDGCPCLLSSNDEIGVFISCHKML